MRNVTALVSGALFGLGLALSGMTLPAKVMGFLDFTGHWDPSLAFVMGGALAIFAPTYFIVRKRRKKPLLEESFDLPTKTKITPQLLAGAAVFGAGWGLAGFCPGTVLTALPSHSPHVLGITGGVIAGILVTRAIQTRVSKSPEKLPQADF